MQAHSFAALEPGLKLVRQDFTIGEPTAHEMLIQITHCSVGRGDVGFLKNSYQIPDLQYPLVAGHELVGTIVALGSDTNDFEVGDRIGVGYQIWSCGICQYCRDGREQLCQRQKCLVLDGKGGFASHINVDQRFVFKIPDSLDSAEATPLLCSGLTVFSAIKKADITSKMTVGVIGIGGLGHIAVQLLRRKTANVIAFSNKTGAAIADLGASKVVPYNSTEIEDQTFDRLFITTPAIIDYDSYLKLLKPDGELWVIGSTTEKTTLSSDLLNDFASRSIKGSYIGSPSEMRELLKLAAEHDIKGKVRVMPMSELNEALKLVDSGNSDFRIVVTND